MQRHAKSLSRVLLDLQSSRFSCIKYLSLSPSSLLVSAMSLYSHAFSGNALRSVTHKSNESLTPQSAFLKLKTLFSTETHESHFPNFKVLPFRKGRPLAGYTTTGPRWRLGWLNFDEFISHFGNSQLVLSENDFVYLGFDNEDDVVYWAVDTSEEGGLVNALGAKQLCFVELRTLMVATDWTDSKSMGELAVAGHAKSLLEWHNTARFCGYCGSATVPIEAGRKRQCSSESCKKRIYPRLDPVVIMLVIDNQNDCALLSKQSRFVPRMWSCLAGFIEPGESLEEAVRRETHEETGIEVGEVVYHSSQPWPVGPSSMPCQLMMGFFAYAKTREIRVDKRELEDAKWHSREEVLRALTYAEYKKAQESAAARVEQMCKGVEKGHNLAADFNVESGELAPMFVPGPFAIAHHLISSWANAHQSFVDSPSNL